MQVIVRSIQLVCLSFLTCDPLLNNEKENRRMLELSACCALCSEQNPHLHLEACYAICKEGAPGDNIKKLRQIYENHYIKLLCRDDTTLAFKIMLKEFGRFEKMRSENQTIITSNFDINNNSRNNNSRASMNNNSTNIEENISKFSKSINEIYFIRIYKAENVTDQVNLLTNSSYIKVENLEPNTKYNITATVVYSNREYSSIVQNQQYITLHRKYTPSKVQNIDLDTYIGDEHDKYSLKAVILWKPALDMTCHYEIVFYSSEKIPFNPDMKSIEIRDLDQLYNYTIEPLALGTPYKIGIRSKNTKEDSKESDLKYLDIVTPSCLEYHNNDLTICPPSMPQHLAAHEEILALNEFSVNITWEKPSLEPDYYTIKILDTEHENNEYESINHTKNATKDQSSLFIPHIILYGHRYEVYLTAFSKGGNTSTYISKTHKKIQVPVDQYYMGTYVYGIVVLLLTFVVVTIITFIICHRRAKIKRYKERCKYFEDLEKKAPMDPNSNFEIVGRNMSLEQLQLDLEDKLFFNDELEIKLVDVDLFEIIGEGAFGMVRRGKLKAGEKKEVDVAVKMLKDQASIEDMKTFRREIEVMKSVGKHPHIVNIVGHYTKNIKEMMLLTEYCSLGNLLDLLRAEWQRINKIVYIQKTTLTPSNSPPAVPYHNKYSINNSVFNYRDKKISTLGNKKMSTTKSKTENIFNFDKVTTLKYKNIGEDNKLRVYKRRPKCQNLNGNNNNNNSNNNSSHHHHHYHHHHRHNYQCNNHHKHYHKNNDDLNKSENKILVNDTTTTTTEAFNENLNNDNIQFNNHILKQKSDNNNDINLSNIINDIDNNTKNNDIKNNDIDDDNTKLVVNKGYGLQSGFCTNFCKCQVDIIDTLTNPTNLNETENENCNNKILDAIMIPQSINNTEMKTTLPEISTKNPTSSLASPLQSLATSPIASTNKTNLTSSISNNVLSPMCLNEKISSTRTTLSQKNLFLNNSNNSNYKTKLINNCNKIQIKNCDCKLKSNRSRIKSSSSNLNDDEATTTTTTLTNGSSTLLIENHGYYKFLNSNIHNKSNTISDLTLNINEENLNYDLKQQHNDYNSNNNQNVNNDNCNDNDNEPNTIENDDNDIILKGFTNYDLINIAKQIAMGMEYLSKCKIVHRDLAARNVLVCKDRTVKIADFGLSRDVYQENVYKKTGNGKLPIKWLAIESMTHQVYTTQSDVWSYGILLYEISTLGGTPYPSIPTTRLLQLLKNGHRMEKPKNCGQALYDLMLSCWNAVPSKRPTFTDIIQSLDEILIKLSDEIQIENLEESNNDKRSKSVSDESYLNPLL